MYGKDRELNALDQESIAEEPAQASVESTLPSSSVSKRAIGEIEGGNRPSSSSAKRRSSTATTRGSRRTSVAAKSSRTNSVTSIRTESHISEKPEPEVDDIKGDDEAEGEEDEAVPDSKERSREKNKVAAAKCRAKKRENMEIIETNHRTLSAENTYLKKHEQQLRATVAELRTLALDHQHCNCGVHQYNMIQAGNLARGLGDLHMQHFGCGASGVHGSERQSSNPLSGFHESPSEDTSTPASHDVGQADQMGQFDLVDLSMDMGQDNLFDLQTPMDDLFAELDTSEYAQGL